MVRKTNRKMSEWKRTDEGGSDDRRMKCKIGKRTNKRLKHLARPLRQTVNHWILY